MSSYTAAMITAPIIAITTVIWNAMGSVSEPIPAVIIARAPASLSGPLWEGGRSPSRGVVVTRAQ